MIKNELENPSRKSIIKAYGWIFISAIIYTISIQGFIQQARTFTAGISALAALPTFLFPQIIPYISLIIAALNIPLLVIFWNKNKRRFMYRTSFYIIIQATFGSLFIIPEISNIFDDLFSIGGSAKISEYQWPVFMLSLIGGILSGFAIGMMWKYGGSSGGTDIITYYFSSKKQLSIGKSIFVVALITTIFSFIMTLPFNDNIRSRWLITLMSTFVMMIISSTVVHFIYPKYSKIEVEVVSSKSELISKHLKENNYIHSWRVNHFTSGYSGNDKSTIKTVMYLLELKDFSRIMLNLDPGAFLTVKRVYAVRGRINPRYIE